VSVNKVSIVVAQIAVSQVNTQDDSTRLQHRLTAIYRQNCMQCSKRHR
jgi:hypothetical protein